MAAGSSLGTPVHFPKGGIKPSTSQCPSAQWEALTLSSPLTHYSYSSTINFASSSSTSKKSQQPSTSTSALSKPSKKSQTKYFIVINISHGKKMVFSDLAQVQASLASLQACGEECKLNINSSLEDALDSGDGLD
ncbi:hypothetical protein ARMGADRAFT_1082408 [Armillaria gallica]|uniref:Uncharacterized protein n=1 Tax=Armillaria gallica TaxID=47427 RepID=A0A2H3DTB5_ARMGA|nr:hypothetical protein ARMGADRAFT_1082408 [Armillaria gallica]